MRARTAAKAFGWVATGALVGGAIAALVTPKNGRAMRKAIRESARHQRESVARVARSVTRECRSAYDAGRNTAGKLATWTRQISA